MQRKLVVVGVGDISYTVLILASSFVFKYCFCHAGSVGQALGHLWICVRAIHSQCFVVVCLLAQEEEHWLLTK